MNLPHSLPDGAAAIMLPAHCGSAIAPGLHAELQAAVAAPEALRIDASAVESVGQATLQLLVAARRERSDLSFTAASAAFVDRVAACRLDEALGLAIVEG